MGRQAYAITRALVSMQAVVHMFVDCDPLFLFPSIQLTIFDSRLDAIPFLFDVTERSLAGPSLGPMPLQHLWLSLTQPKGRSPYEDLDPLEGRQFTARRVRIRPDSGVHIQQYDSRGRPENLESKAAARELRKAQNDILYSVGIVGKSDEKHKIRNVIYENSHGFLLSAVDSTLTYVGIWWITSLRARFQVFENYSTLPLTAIIRLERTRVGNLAFYFSGLPFSVISGLLNVTRNHLLDGLIELFDNDDEEEDTRKLHVRKGQRVLGIPFQRILNLTLSTLAIPFQLFSLLQVLQIVPLNALPKVQELSPFHAGSLLGLPCIPATMSVPVLFHFGYEVLRSPLCLAFMRNLAADDVERFLFSRLRQIVPKPDRPDNISIRAAIADDLDETDIPGLRSTIRRVRGTQPDLYTALDQMPNIFRGTAGWLRSVSRSLLGPFPATHENTGSDHTRELTNNLRTAEEQETARILASARLAGRGDELLSLGNPSNNPYNPAQDQPSNVIANGAAGDSNDATPHPAEEIPSEALTNGQQDNGAAWTAEERSRFNGRSTSFQNHPRDSILQQITMRQQLAIAHASPEAQNSEETLLDLRALAPNDADDNSPPTTPTQSPRLRASFLHRSSDSNTVQLEISSQRLRRHQAPALDEWENMIRYVFETCEIAGRHSQETQSRESLEQADETLRHLDRILDRVIEYERTQIGNASNLEIQQRAVAFRAEFAEARRMIMHASQPMTRGDSGIGEDVDMARRAPNAETDRFPVRTDWDFLSDDTSEQNEEMIQETNAHRGDNVPPILHHLYNSHTFHRVTTLSNLPSDTLASHWASLLTSFLLLPLDSLIFRSVARTYFSRPGVRFGTSPLIGLSQDHDIRAPDCWFGGRPLGLSAMVGYAGTILLTMGIQEFAYHAIWRIGTFWIIRVGRSFGWGTM